MTTRQEERHERAVFGQRDPDPRGYYGPFGGRFVPETLMAPVDELTREYFRVREDPAFLEEFHGLLQHYVGRPTPLYEARRLSAEAGGARIFLKREDLTHTGAHKINNALGQALLARRMGKRRIVAETGAGQHGVATATACALLGLECDVYMGAEDMARQAPNVLRMRLLGATVRQVDAGSRTLKDAINEAMRDWVATVADTYYLLGSVLGPHPYPLMVREFQSIIGREARGQLLAQAGRLPEAVVACVGGGSNAMGIFDAFVADAGVRLIGVEAGGEAIVPGRHAARFAGGSVGILQGTKTWVLQDAHGNIELTHSISAGLDYAAVGPEHAWLRQQGRTGYAYATDAEALAAFQRVARLEGILPALESSHGVSHAMRVAGDLAPDAIVLVNLSGRGDKDLQTVEKALGRAERRVTSDGRRVTMMTRIAETFAALKAAGRPGLVTYITAGDPIAGAHARLAVRAGARGRRRDRAGCAVLRSARRWPGDSAGDRARADVRHDAGRGAAPGGRRARGAGHAHRLVHLRQSDRPYGLRGLRRSGRRVRCGRRPAARRAHRGGRRRAGTAQRAEH